MSREARDADEPTALTALVGDAAAFLRDVFGRSVWTGRSERAAELLDIDDVDAIVSAALRAPALRMIRDGRPVATAEFCTPTRIGRTTVPDVADHRKVLDQYRRGATLVLQSLHRTWLPMSRWCAELESELGWPVQANAYLTPPDERGLDPHADGHDVAVIQLVGSKRWTIADTDGFEMTRGDVTYLPSGTRHAAATTDLPSLHLTVGIHRPDHGRLARSVASIAAERAEQRAKPSDGASTIAALVHEATGEVEPDEATERLRREPRRHVEGLLAASVRRPTIASTTKLVPAPDLRSRLDGDRVHLTWRTGALWLPGRTAAALDLLATSRHPIEIADLPGLTPDDRLVLARRLLDEAAVTL